jgi:adenine phosphoribosyltransferase
MLSAMNGVDFVSHIRDIHDWPEPGIVFKDITPLLAHPGAFSAAIDAMSAPFAGAGITKVVGIEARGFILGAPIADRLDAGFVPIRKAGKLPHDIHHQEYDLEYGTDRIEVHSDAVGPGDRVLIVDDVLATGGTAAAAIALVRALAAEVTGFTVLVELGFLNGRAKLNGTGVHAVVHYGPS